jgi:hypothetical protein
LPRHAQISDRFTILRSVAHTGGGHPAGSLQLLSGDPDAQDKLKPVYPDFMSVANRLRFDPHALERENLSCLDAPVASPSCSPASSPFRRPRMTT